MSYLNFHAKISHADSKFLFSTLASHCKMRLFVRIVHFRTQIKALISFLNKDGQRTCLHYTFVVHFAFAFIAAAAAQKLDFTAGSVLVTVNLAFEFSLLKPGFAMIVILLSFQVNHGLRTEINDVSPSGFSSFVACRVMQCASSVNSAASSLQRLRKSLIL